MANSASSNRRRPTDTFDTHSRDPQVRAAEPSKRQSARGQLTGEPTRLASSRDAQMAPRTHHRLRRTFPSAEPDVVVYGHSHREEVHHVAVVLYVNPGSPTLPRNQSTRPGTIGILDIDNGSVQATLFQLTDSGMTPIIP